MAFVEQFEVTISNSTEEAQGIQERIIGKLEFKSYTPKTIISVERLRLELDQIRRLGYAESAEEFIEGTHSMAAPIYNFTGQAVATLGTTGPKSRISPRRITEIAEPLLALAARISYKMGYVPEEKLETGVEEKHKTIRDA